MGSARFFLCPHHLKINVIFSTLSSAIRVISLESEDRVAMSEFVIEKVEEFASTLLPSMGLELVEVQFRREGHGWVLRIFIDSEGGITVDHCADVSREVSDHLDVEDLIEHPYHLEVSSPGLERPLKQVSDYERFIGRKAKVKLREELEGQKVYVGEILQVNEDSVLLQVDKNKTVEVLFSIIRKARLAL